MPILQYDHFVFYKEKMSVNHKKSLKSELFCLNGGQAFSNIYIYIYIKERNHIFV